MTKAFLDSILTALNGDAEPAPAHALTFTGSGALAAWFDVTDLAAASLAAACCGIADIAGGERAIGIDRRLTSFWFGTTLRPIGWQVPPVWDAVAGDYRTGEGGWIRLHTNAKAHREAALAVLGEAVDRQAMEPLVAKWSADELESAIVQAGGCAAAMRSLDDWAKHPQGGAVAWEPLMHWKQIGGVAPDGATVDSSRPLRNVRILDLTRVLAGPVAGRFLAGFGADVLRIDPPTWDEPAVVPEVTLGKTCAGLDLNVSEDRHCFERLLAGADILLHGYRPGALSGLGYDDVALLKINPGLIDVRLDAYGWTGPWAGRRGFDSLVQMSAGIAEYGMRMSGADRPVPLPVQALDHATGYLLAAAVLRALHQRRTDGKVLSARLSLARTANLLARSRRANCDDGLAVETETDLSKETEHTDWGPARRIRFPAWIDGIDATWDRPAGCLRASPAEWT